MKPSQDALKIIEEFEGTILKAYVDPETGGEPITIGKGSTTYKNAGLAKYGRTKVRLGDTLTLEEANQEKMASLAIIAAKINATGAKLTQSQFDAAVSFCYNAGFPAPQMRRLREGKLDDFRKYMARYINEGGPSELGLRRRRKAEMALWDKDKGVAPVTTPTWIALTRKSGDKPKNIFRGMNAANVVTEHEWATRQELVNLLQAVPMAGTAVVTVEDWEPEGKPVEPTPAPTPVSVATLSRTGKKEAKGCEELKLVIGDQSFICRSGQPWAQVFEQGNMNNVPGSMRPLPAGKWKIGLIEFAGGKDNYEADWSEAIGPVWVGLEPMFKTRRSAIGIHIDGNAYGTAGCLGARSMADLKGIVAALRKYNPKILDVVW
jgi:GH24 family phage-related lysozyme (muramidase)